ncbi:MAG: hypothetical protein CM1200mP3_12350 [Chloroflexota bacterium]|nr:MAG: hypothetical protein CM1200mP3_12350 [Chloroflexota bacterium]
MRGTNLGKRHHNRCFGKSQKVWSLSVKKGKSQHRVIDRSKCRVWGAVETTSQNILVAFRDIKSNLVALSKSLKGEIVLTLVF